MAVVSTPVCDFGWKAADFALAGVDGKTYRLADVKGAKGTLVIFMCNHCPYVKAAIGRIVRDARELAALGIGCIGIMSNDTAAYPEDSFENMKTFARRHSLPFPYVIDETQEVARAYGAACTPDFFGFNAALELQYRGQLDDGRMNSDKVTRRDLFEAMAAIAKTGQGPREQIPSMGCSIKWRG
jgi:peroxiredoxin